MRNVIGAASPRTATGRVEEFEAKWTVDGDAGMQSARRLPGPVPHTAHLDVGVIRRQHRHRKAVARDNVPLAVGTYRGTWIRSTDEST